MTFANRKEYASCLLWTGSEIMEYLYSGSCATSHSCFTILKSWHEATLLLGELYGFSEDLFPQ